MYQINKQSFSEIPEKVITLFFYKILEKWFSRILIKFQWTFQNFWESTVVNSWKPLTIITKHSILDVAAALDPPLISTLSWSSHRLKLT